jgi:hypothetical protein
MRSSILDVRCSSIFGIYTMTFSRCSTPIALRRISGVVVWKAKVAITDYLDRWNQTAVASQNMREKLWGRPDDFWVAPDCVL